MRNKYWYWLFAMIGGLFLMGGCSTGKDASPDATKETQKEKQEISVSLPVPLSTLDTTQTTDKVTFTVVQHLFEGLYRLDDSSTPVPGIAESVDVSEDGTDYTFHLRKEAKWSDGVPVSSKDFLYAWKRLVDPATIGPNAYWLDNVINSKAIREGKADVETIGLEAPDEQTFVVHLENPQPSFLSVISIGWLAPQRQEFVEKNQDKYASSSERLIYNGPFILEDWDPTSDTWTMKKNEHYYDADKVQLTQINGSTIKEENTGINLFQADELQLTKISGQYVQQYQNDPAYVTQKDVSNMFLDFNQQTTPALKNVHVRKAIAQAIDKEKLTKFVLNDGSEPLYGLIPAHLYANQQTKQDFRQYSGNYQLFDVKKAQKEWKQAQKEIGEELTLSLLINDTDGGKKVSEFIKDQLETNLKGLRITINQQPANNVNQSRSKGDYELSFSGWIAGSNDLQSYFNLYQSGSSYNYGGYQNAQYAELVEKARTVDANNEEAMFADYKEAERLLLEEAGQVPIYQSASSYLVDPNLKQVIYHSYGDFYNLREAYVE